jgi:uncharacterized protein YjbJ (UPF0337 family)
MNRNQMKGAAKNAAGKVQQRVGELTGNKTQQAKGIAKQVEGKVQRGAGNVEQALDKAHRKIRGTTQGSGSLSRHRRTANERLS